MDCGVKNSETRRRGDVRGAGPVLWCLLLVSAWLLGLGGSARSAEGQAANSKKAASGDAEVRMSLADFERLRAASLAPEPDLEDPALPFAVERAELELTVDGDRADLRQVVELVVWREGFQTVPWPGTGTLLSVDWNGSDGFVQTDGDGPELRVRGVGRHRLELRSALSLDSLEGRERPVRSLQFKRPPAALVRASVELVDATEELTFSDGAAVSGRQGVLEEEGDGRYRFRVGAAEMLTLHVHGARRAPEASSLPLRLRHDVFTGLEVGRTRVSVLAKVRSRILQGRVSELRFTVPEGLEVLGVDGHQGGWDVAEGVLTVYVDDDTVQTFDVRLMGAARSRIEDPILRPMDGENGRFLVAAKAVGDGLLELAEPVSLRFANPAEIEDGPPGIDGSGRGGYGRLAVLRNPSDAPVWEVEWAEATDVLATQIDRLLVEVVIGEDGRAAYQMRVFVRNRGGRLLQIRPPAGFRWITAARDGVPILPGATSDGLAVALESDEIQRRLFLFGDVALELPADGRLQVPLASFSAPVAKVEVHLMLPPGWTGTLVDAARAGEISPVDLTVGRRTRVDEEKLIQSNAIAGQLARYGTVRTSSEGNLRRPPGFSDLTAAWSALSDAPRALEVELRSTKEDRSWF